MQAKSELCKTTTISTSTAANNPEFIEDYQRQTYGTSVQGVYGTGQSQLGNSANRYQGQLWTSTNSDFYPAENYTTEYIEMKDISIECAQIGTISLQDSQVVFLL